MHLSLRVDPYLLALPADRVREVVRLDGAVPPPFGPDEVRALLNVRGRVYTVIDPQVLVGLPPSADSNAGHAVLLEIDGRSLALAAREPAASIAREDAALPIAALPLPPRLCAVVTSTVLLEQGWAAVIDPQLLVASIASSP